MKDLILVLCLQFAISSEAACKSELSKSNVCCNQSNALSLLNLVLETLVLFCGLWKHG